MKILPEATFPWSEPIARRHRPLPTSDYTQYRQCLRWDFGFTCAFCLCHEADLAHYGVEGSGLTGIEHFVAQSFDSSLRTDYANLFYVCRFCNQSRGKRSHYSEDPSRKLLNPVETTWANHFALVDGSLVPQPSDPSAEYTEKAYRLNQPQKVAMRHFRRQTLEYLLRVIREAPAKKRQLMDLAIERSDPEMLETARLLGDVEKRAWEDLARFRAIPLDAKPCICDSSPTVELPGFLVRQLIEISRSA